MKKKWIISLFAVLILGSTSCDKDDDAPILGAKVFVTVKNLVGVPQAGTTVYLYKDNVVTNETTPNQAKKQIVTDSNGVAEFSLNFTELNITESQTSLYFAVFYTVGNQSLVAGSEGVTVKRDNTKYLTITIPL